MLQQNAQRSLFYAVIEIREHIRTFTLRICRRFSWFICLYGCMFYILPFNSASCVFLSLCMLCSVYSVFIVPTGILRLPWLRFFRDFSSFVRQMPEYTSQRRGTVRTLPKLIVLFYVLFVCKCVLYYCHRLATQLQLNISYIYIYI